MAISNEDRADAHVASLLDIYGYLGFDALIELESELDELAGLIRTRIRILDDLDSLDSNTTISPKGRTHETTTR